MQSWKKLSLLGAGMGCLLNLGAGVAWAWGEDGHEITGQTAQLYLQRSVAGRQTLQRVQAILAPGETMARAATWADRIKSGAFDSDSARFLNNSRNEGHKSWHFVNLPFQATAYQAGAVGTTPTDIVQTMKVCIKVLRGESSRFTQREALRLLIHYAGDVHQPLHVGIGYVVPAGGGFKFVDPATVPAFPRPINDLGGNILFAGMGGNLHSFWDSNLVGEATRNRSVPNEATLLVSEFPQGSPLWVSAGDASSWPEQWATDTVGFSKGAYDHVRIIRRRGDSFDVDPPDNYRTDQAAVVKAQLAKGGFRLSRLLMAIFAPGP